MTLTDDQIIQYQTLYKNRFGREIGKEDAQREADKLIQMVRRIYRPMTEAEYQSLEERRAELRD